MIHAPIRATPGIRTEASARATVLYLMSRNLAGKACGNAGLISVLLLVDQTGYEPLHANARIIR